MWNALKKHFDKKTGYYNNVFLTKSDYFFIRRNDRKSRKLYVLLFGTFLVVGVFVGICVLEAYLIG
jgi:hypothetical protein